MSFIKFLVDEINLARTDPLSYAEKLSTYASYFDENVMKIPNSNCDIETVEGPAAYEECAKYLNNFELALDALEPSKALTRIANDYLNQVLQSEQSEFSRIDMRQFVNKYGSFKGNLTRALEFGGATPEQIVTELLASDGDTNRRYRNMILDKGFKKIGVARGEHEEYGECTIIVFATDFKNNVDSNDDEDYESSNDVPNYINKSVSGSQQEQRGADTKILMKEEKNEETIVEGGIKKKKITIIRQFKDGHKEREVRFENL